jgi:hypothetical protein
MKREVPLALIIGLGVVALALVSFMAYRSFNRPGELQPPPPGRASSSSTKLPENFKQMTPAEKRALGMQRMGKGDGAPAR